LPLPLSSAAPSGPAASTAIRAAPRFCRGCGRLAVAISPAAFPTRLVLYS